MTCTDFKKLCEKHHPDEIGGITKTLFVEHARVCPTCLLWLKHRLREEEAKPVNPAEESYIARKALRGL